MHKAIVKKKSRNKILAKEEKVEEINRKSVQINIFKHNLYQPAAIQSIELSKRQKNCGSLKRKRIYRSLEHSK